MPEALLKIISELKKKYVEDAIDFFQKPRRLASR